jgi:superfamily II DNA helicase RecQ
MSCLESLHRRNMLDRFIIDEAHCVSQVGGVFIPSDSLLLTVSSLDWLKCGREVTWDHFVF